MILNPAPEICSEGAILLLDKPYGWTSFDLVNKVRWALKYRTRKKVKVGHAGTLDPLASGLMIVLTGKMTREQDRFMGLPKTYTGIFTLGATTPCYDLEKPVDFTFPTAHITSEAIMEAAQSFLGKQEQLPPLFSAKKIEGERAYNLARNGEEATIKKVPIEITKFDVLEINMPHVHFEIACSKGTYIRSIARDFGMALHSGAHLTALRRTAIGDFTLDQVKPGYFEALISRTPKEGL